MTISVAGMFATVHLAGQNVDGGALASCQIDYHGEDGPVTITHDGGRAFDTATLRVIFENATSGTSTRAFAVADGDADSTFEPGESGTFGRIGERTTVTVTTSDTIVCTEVLAPRSETTTATSSDPDETTSEPTPTTTPANAPPDADAGSDARVDGERGSTTDLRGSATDSDGDTLTYDWEITDADGIERSVALRDAATTTPTFEVTGNVTDRNHTVTVELTVADGDGATASDTTTVTVTEHNPPPTVDAGNDTQADGSDTPAAATALGSPPDDATVSPADTTQRVYAVDASGALAPGQTGVSDLLDSVTLDAAASDPDGDPLTYDWTVVDADGIADKIALRDDDTLRPTFAVTSLVSQRDRTVTLRLTATDADGATASDTVNVTVLSNKPPNAVIDRDSSRLFTTNLNASESTDPDGDPLTYEWKISNTGGFDLDQLRLDQSGATASVSSIRRILWLFLGSTHDVEITLVVSDDDGATDTATITVGLRGP
ncbi:hypothetical protein GCM10009039_06450 [Halocalculus aciditolerans]|uniref:PKD/Chitinase domain-containing protein n=1 Tax=Halocalculus aciditolerans TaxID=1383812 RepID=A0A830FFW1_9EURY|nr:hypothetical protein GCM10009039_06450 [Halocalculus aciditolerans]